MNVYTGVAATPSISGARPGEAGERRQPEVSVVVATYNQKRWSDLVACLAALKRQTRQASEVIVVVDHNPSLLGRTRRAFPWARVFANRRPRGLSGARNTGVEVARSEIVAFVDDDAVPAPDWLEQLLAGFRDEQTVGVGGALEPSWSRERPRWVPAEFLWVFGCSYEGLPQRVAPIRNPIGANMAARRSVLREVGGFLEGAGGREPRELRGRGVVRAGGDVPDDTELAIRVHRHRPQSIWLYQPAAIVAHTVTPERASLGYFLRRCFEEGAGKARLARLVGPADGLESERRYLTRVLPRGLGRALGDLARGRLSGGLQAGAISIGLAAAALGYITAAIRAILPR